jgi:thioredoxin reductase (NADPH)
MENIYDVIVIGGGVAGASAGMYAARFNLKTLVFAAVPGGLITTTHLVENYPGIKSITGPDMGVLFIEHARETGAEFQFSLVKQINKLSEKNYPIFEVIDSSDKKYYAKTIVLATGTNHKHLGVPGEKEYSSKGVSYCALCDAVFFKNKVVAVVGGGDSAAIEAKILADHAAKVHVFVRGDAMRAEPINLQRIEQNEKIQIHYQTEIIEVLGNGNQVTSVKLKNGETIELQGVFVAIGWDPQNELAKQLGVELDSRGMIIINRYSETNVTGVFAAGDITNAEFKQAIIGAAEGVSASYKIYKYLESIAN